MRRAHRGSQASPDPLQDRIDTFEGRGRAYAEGFFATTPANGLQRSHGSLAQLSITLLDSNADMLQGVGSAIAKRDSDNILLRPGRLDEQKFAVMGQHVKHGLYRAELMELMG